MIRNVRNYQRERQNKHRSSEMKRILTMQESMAHWRKAVGDPTLMSEGEMVDRGSQLERKSENGLR